MINIKTELKENILEILRDLTFENFSKKETVLSKQLKHYLNKRENVSIEKNKKSKKLNFKITDDEILELTNNILYEYLALEDQENCSANFIAEKIQLIDALPSDYKVSINLQHINTNLLEYVDFSETISAKMIAPIMGLKDIEKSFFSEHGFIISLHYTGCIINDLCKGYNDCLSKFKQLIIILMINDVLIRCHLQSLRTYYYKDANLNIAITNTVKTSTYELPISLSKFLRTLTLNDDSSALNEKLKKSRELQSKMENSSYISDLRRINMALSWFFDSAVFEYERNYFQAFIVLILALEVILIMDDDEKHGKSKKIADRCGFIIGKNHNHRREISKHITDVYVLRNDIFHGNQNHISLKEQDLYFKLKVYVKLLLIHESSLL